MKKDNQMARIEQFIGQLQTPESKDAVILLDSEMDSKRGANDATNDFQNCKNCRNGRVTSCGVNGGDCTNLPDMCDNSQNGGSCYNMPSKQVALPGCS